MGRGMRAGGQLQPEPPAAGLHRGSWRSQCLLDPTEVLSLLNLSFGKENPCWPSALLGELS